MLLEILNKNKLMKKNNRFERIYISSTHKRELAFEFNTSIVTVRQALDHYNNSDLAKKIRRRAKEMLLAEVGKIQD